GNSFPSNVLKLGFAVSVYCISSNRNMHKFKGITRKYEDVMRDIKVLVRERLSLWKKNPVFPASRRILRAWEVP
ncbi:hypothetical protein U1Q18_010229, partial [Sarracenia purpurea var. burkii]